MKKLIAALSLLCLAVPALAQVQSLSLQDVKRKYIVYTPSTYAGAPAQKFPLVLNFAGGGMTAAEQMLYTQMNRSADRHGYIVVYPQGIKNDWNVGFGMDYKGGSDDVGFVRNLLAALERQYRVDPRRVYATGLSRGGFFALRLAAEMPERFAAVASVGAPMPEPVIAHHQERRPVGVMLVHGTADAVVAYDGKAGGYLSARESAGYWAQVNNVDWTAPPARQLPPAAGDATSVSISEHGTPQHRVALVTVRDGGHTWPGADPFNVGLPIGATSKSVDINELIWSFFRQHGKPD
jgi:polyhydroxybutyrate depolymerase